MIKLIWKQYLKRPIGCLALIIVCLFILVGIYAPFLASSKPFVVRYEGSWYFPLFRYLFYSGFYTKSVDLFYNLIIFTLPLLLLGLWIFKRHKGLVWLITIFFQCIVFSWLLLSPVKDPAYVTPKYAELKSAQVQFKIPALLRDFHWEDDAGGDQELNRKVSFWNLTRVNHKDLVASLIFGVRISLAVGLLAVALSLLIGIPLGACAGYFAGKTDIIICRLLEIWEAIPTFFMLLLVVAISQSKSIFIVIAVLGLFGWVGIARFIRGEFLKQRTLPYVEASYCLGFGHTHIIFSDILPNAIPPVLTLLPFAVMGAITSEAALSFLGLGEEGSSSWGVLMDEGRGAFPGESYLLWPPALLLTLLLVAIAIVGDTLRDAIDPKMKR